MVLCELRGGMDFCEVAKVVGTKELILNLETMHQKVNFHSSTLICQCAITTELLLSEIFKRPLLLPHIPLYCCLTSAVKRNTRIA